MRAIFALCLVPTLADAVRAFPSIWRGELLAEVDFGFALVCATRDRGEAKREGEFLDGFLFFHVVLSVDEARAT